MALQKVNRHAFPSLYDTSLNKQLLSLIGDGKENGVHLETLVKLTGVKDRTVRKAIEYMRRAGVVICADSISGYYFPDTAEELKLYIHQEENRAHSTLYTLQTAQRLIAEVLCG